MTDQPTPTSSLEEAREEVINAALLPFTPSGEPLRTYVTERVARFEAAARAEVIREVEAEIVALKDCPFCGAHKSHKEYCVMRALSQGGENGGVR